MGARWHIYHPHFKLHLAPLALLALAIQLIAIFGPLGSDDLPRRILLVLSYLTLAVFIAANLRRPGIGVIGAGVWLNFLVIVANGGLMPITAETLEKTGDVPEDARVGAWISGTKDVLRERDDVRLYFLSDRLAYDVSPLRAFSIGDVFILSGAVLLTGELLLPRVKRVPTTKTEN